MDTFLPTVIHKFEELTKTPENFLSCHSSKADDLKNVCKALHDNLLQFTFEPTFKSKVLSKLLIDGFDEEQVWQQIELKNKVSKSRLAMCNKNKRLSRGKFDELRGNHKVESGQSCINSKVTNKSVENINTHISSADEKSSGEEEHDMLDSDSDGINDDEYDEGSKSDVESEHNKRTPSSKENDNYSPKQAISPDKISMSKPRKRSSQVDDQFFKLSKLEQFLRLEDLKEEKARDGELEDSDDESVDLFQDIPSDGTDDSIDDEQEIGRTKSSRSVMYQDFFDPVNSEDDDNDEKKKNIESDDEEDEPSDDEDMPSDDLEENNIKMQDKSSKENAKNKTEFEIQQDRIKQQISEYEQSMLKPKPWQLTGEVIASKRPTDGLLHLETDFDMNAKPAIVQDQELCDKLENMIKMAIKNKAYSDGVRQYKTNDEIISYKKEVQLEQNKSQKSLAQEYEDMYLKKQGKLQEEEDPKHKEIKKLMDSLFPELHALFAHIPKPAVPEIKIVSNLPAISVEEVAPTSVSDVTLLAPEEVKKRTGLIKGQTERSDVDRKRERRKKKLHQKFKQKKLEKESAEGNPLKTKKLEKLTLLKKLKQDRNTKIAKMDAEKIKSSKDFFGRLQDTINNPIVKEKTSHSKKKRKQ